MRDPIVSCFLKHLTRKIKLKSVTWRFDISNIKSDKCLVLKDCGAMYIWVLVLIIIKVNHTDYHKKISQNLLRHYKSFNFDNFIRKGLSDHNKITSSHITSKVMTSSVTWLFPNYYLFFVFCCRDKIPLTSFKRIAYLRFQ